MPNFLYLLPDLYVFFILVLFTISISTLFIFINKYFIYEKLHYKDNPTISSFCSVIGIIYGVLMGFLCLYLINNQDHASQYVQNEANATANIYISSLWLPEPAKGKIQQDVKLYINEAINHEWPLMKQFKKIGYEGDRIILSIANDLKSIKAQTNTDVAQLRALLTSINELYNARHSRVDMSYNILPPELWEVILIGTILIIAINYAFRVNIYLHLFGTMTFAIMAASMLFLLVTLDTPFQGEFVVTPRALSDVLDLMQSIKPQDVK